MSITDLYAKRQEFLQAILDHTKAHASVWQEIDRFARAHLRHPDVERRFTKGECGTGFWGLAYFSRNDSIGNDYGYWYLYVNLQTGDITTLPSNVYGPLTAENDDTRLLPIAETLHPIDALGILAKLRLNEDHPEYTTLPKRAKSATT